MRHPFLSPLGLAVCLAALVAQRPAAQQPPPQEPPPAPLTFRAEANFVEVHAIVTDRDGAFVRDLTAEDFQIIEDGQEIDVKPVKSCGERKIRRNSDHARFDDRDF